MPTYLKQAADTADERMSKFFPGETFDRGEPIKS
jgi:hypothetical protein